MRPRTVAALVVVGSAAALAGNLAGELGGVLRGAVGGLTLGALVVAIRRTDDARAWTLVTIGIALWVAGDTVSEWIAYRDVESSAAGYTAEALYLASYPFLGAGLFDIARARNGTRGRDGLLEAAVLALAGVIIVWALLVAPQAEAGLALVDRVILAAYPLGDGLLLAALAWLALTPGRRGPSLWLLAGALSLTFVADLLFDLFTRLGSPDRMIEALNPLWPISYLLFAAAALHPSARELTEPVPEAEERTHPARLVFLGLVLFAGPLVAGLGGGDVLVTVCSLAVAALVVGRFVSLVRDQERARAALAAGERRWRQLAEGSPVGIHEVGPDLTITYANSESERLFGRSVQGVAAPELLDTVHEHDRAAILAAADAMISGAPGAAEFRLRSTDGDERWVSWHGTPLRGPNGEFAGAFASTLDVTPLKDAQARLAHQATQDPLTGLPNRGLLRERLQASIARLGRHPGRVGVLFLDLDRFKLVNDLLGHDAGDRLLVEVARRIRSTIRTEDTAARYGGDEFVILVEDARSPRDLKHLALRLIALVEEPISFGDGDIDVSTSIGIAIATGPDDDADALLRDADAAMYRAKTLGRARYELFGDWCDQGGAPR